MNIHDKYVIGDILKVDFPEKSFDAVICFEVVEHLEMDVAVTLIKKIERWAKRKIIITTPNGFIPQGEYDGNELQEHKSGWTPRHFKSLGFEVRGLQGLKRFANSKYPIIGFLWRLSFPMVYFTPSLSWRLLAIKTINEV
jgi:2-polyprenyl-3-methyl-5-hydroxy-6-metoxy-1,4-benzoquinol methylase